MTAGKRYTACRECAACKRPITIPFGDAHEKPPPLRIVVEGPVIGITTRGAHPVRTASHPRGVPTQYVDEVRLGAARVFVECTCGHRHEVPSGLINVQWETFQ